MLTSEQFLASDFVRGIARVLDHGKDKHGDRAYLGKGAFYHSRKFIKHARLGLSDGYDSDSGEHHFFCAGARLYLAWDCLMQGKL